MKIGPQRKNLWQYLNLNISTKWGEEHLVEMICIPVVQWSWWKIKRILTIHGETWACDIGVSREVTPPFIQYPSLWCSRYRALLTLSNPIRILISWTKLTDTIFIFHACNTYVMCRNIIKSCLFILVKKTFKSSLAWQVTLVKLQLIMMGWMDKMTTSSMLTIKSYKDLYFHPEQHAVIIEQNNHKTLKDTC